MRFSKYSDVQDKLDELPENATVREVMTDVYGEDFAAENYRSGISHVASVHERREGRYIRDEQGFDRYESDYIECLVINHTQGTSLYGYEEPVTVANYRTLQDDWSDLEGLSDGPFSDCKVIALDLDKPAPANLVEVLEGLSDYPVLDEQEWSNVEQEMIQEHWESYGANDVASEVAEALGLDSRLDLTEYALGVIERLVWEGIVEYGCGSGYPTMEDVSSCDFGGKEIAQWLKVRVGRQVSGKTSNGYGTEYMFDLRRHKMVENW
ncbi:hypothetical protein KIV66_gp88 [Mycobacterium phage MyraDee]|uniref:Uncharacterized protein n=1 Tax=Mycobacterium phage MyraDee TaxID=2024303 RepID=A0A222Z0W4_9CAUD|nr:hypothetical protein KIV66_gp88 [Mycobacterium phage MyraDee]ASR77195.1 hypothetical protein SEA_MYRADEE_88 [Mycobacterium phage MyraDee]